MLNTGCGTSSDTQPNTRFGQHAVAAHRVQQPRHRRLGREPEVNWATISPVRKTAPNRLPPMVFAMSEASESVLSNVPPGDTSVTK